ncbi:MAG: hypothetical protein WCJ21_07540 [Planctomycetota bacterium]
MRYQRIFASGDGGSRIEDVEFTTSAARVADGVSPLLASGPHPCKSITFLEIPPDATQWRSHVAPGRRWVLVLPGRFAITTSDGLEREFGPGDVILAEDTTGQGHVFRPLTQGVRFAMIAAVP